MGGPFHLIHHLSEKKNKQLWRCYKHIKSDRKAVREEIFKTIVQHIPRFDRSYEQIKVYLSQIQYHLVGVDSDYGYNFLVEGSRSRYMMAHILLDKIPDEMKAELNRGSSTPYPSLSCILQYSNDVIKVLL